MGIAGLAAIGSEAVAWTSGQEQSWSVIALALLALTGTFWISDLVREKKPNFLANALIAKSVTNVDCRHTPKSTPKL